MPWLTIGCGGCLLCGFVYHRQFFFRDGFGFVFSDASAGFYGFENVHFWMPSSEGNILWTYYLFVSCNVEFCSKILLRTLA